MTPRSAILVDLDGTLTVDDKRVGYPERPRNDAVARAVAAARARGYGVEVVTARGMRTWNNDRALVEQHVRPQAARWLAEHEVTHDALHVGKPWCGPRGFYVDDRNLHLEEFVFRFAGPFADARVEVRGEAHAHERLARVERWLDVVAYRYEGSLPPLVAQDPLVGAAADATHALLARPGANPAAWFALHGEALDRPRPVAQVDRFALVPVAWAEGGFEAAVARVARDGGIVTP